MHTQVYDSVGDVHCAPAEVLVRVLPDSTLRSIEDVTPQVCEQLLQCSAVVSMCACTYHTHVHT